MRRAVLAAVLVAVNAAVLVWFLVPPGPGFDKLRIDLDVYRLGADVWLSGGDLYGRLPPTIIGSQLPFTYPPVSAALFTPFTVVPYVVASAALTLLSIAALVLVVVLVTRALDVRPAPVLVAALVPVALLLEPVRVTIYYGQVNLLLMALVVADCLVRHPRWPRGALVGFAAAVKLTPAAFVLFFLARGDRKAAVTSGLSFLAVTAAGFVLNPAGSVKYWTDTVFDPNRIGKVFDEANQSLNGVLERIGVERGLVWLVLVAGVVAVGAVAVTRVTHPVDALGLNALIVLLVSPVSWSHHWVWCVPVLLAVWRVRPVFAVAGAVLCVLSPHWWWDADDGWTFLTLTVGNAYVWCALAVLGWRATARPLTAVEHLPSRSTANA